MSQQTQNPPAQVLALPGLGDDADDLSLASPPSPPWWRRRGTIIAIVVFLLLVLLGGILFSILNRRRPVTYQYQQVTTGNLNISINATGPLQGGTYNINFSGSGKIAEIDVSVGQHVEQGQVVAKLDKTSLQDAVNQAQAAYMAAVTALNSQQANASAQQGVSGSSINSAQTTLNNAKTNLSKTKAQSTANVDAAQVALNNAEANLAAVQQQANASIQAAQVAVNNAEANLQATQQQALAQEEACDATPAALGTPTPTPSCQAAYNATVTQAQTQLNTAEANLNTAETNANASITTAQNQVNAAQASLNTAEKQASANNATAQGQVNAAQASLTSAESQANANNTTSNGQVSNQQAMVNSDLVALQTAEHNLDNATLRAPHAGIITVINGTVGGTPGVPANASTSTVGTSGTFIQIVDPSVLQVVADVNETDTANLKVGDPAQFTVNAYGTRAFTGTVSAISPNGQTVSNVVTFPVTIDVNMSQLNGAVLLPGMTANVTITVIQRIGVLLLPVDAVNFARLQGASTTTAAQGGVPQLITPQEASAALQQAQQMLQSIQNQPNVASENPIPAYVLEPASNNKVIIKPVVLGLTDGTSYEVLAGLTNGETVYVGTGGSGFGTNGSGPGGRGGIRFGG